MKNITVQGLIEEIASNSPVPGGGAVSALCASMSASLCSMVMNLTIGKKFYQEYDAELKSRIETAKEETFRLKDEFLDLMEQDNAAFNLVMTAFKLPKETDEEKALRAKKIEEGYIAAMNVPLEVSRKALGLFEFLELAAKSGNPNCITDAAVGCHQAMSALEGAILNVRINLPGIKDATLVAKVQSECMELLEKGKSWHGRILEIVKEKMN